MGNSRSNSVSVHLAQEDFDCARSYGIEGNFQKEHMAGTVTQAWSHAGCTVVAEGSATESN